MLARNVPPENRHQIGRRLSLLRRAIAGEKQADFCRLVGIQPNTWSQYESGKNRIALEQAIQIVRETGATLDFIYLDDWRAMPLRVVERMRELAAAEGEEDQKRA
jgi:transcriptional regulator with XRE-family HTH domain